jgi:phosphoribosylamine--glycine ligase
MGDPETQVVLPRIKNDFLELMVKTANGKLDSVKLEIEKMSYANVVAASKGYPEQYEKGKIISGLEAESDSIIFHAGTKKESENIVTNGGRVFSVVSRAESFDSALKKSYQNIKSINFEGKHYRKDLGFDL